MKNSVSISLTAPLGVDWEPQWVFLTVPGMEPGNALRCTAEDGTDIPAQPSGRQADEVVLWLGLRAGEERTLRFESVYASPPLSTDLKGKHLGSTACAWTFGSSATSGQAVPPLTKLGNWPMSTEIRSPSACLDSSFRQTAAGPVFDEAELSYRFENGGRYTIRLQFSKHEPVIRVHEIFSAGLGAELVWQWNPENRFDQLIRHTEWDFEQEKQPLVETLDQPRVDDLLFKVQCPPIGDDVVPSHCRWFGMSCTREPDKGMLGLIAVQGKNWVYPVESMPVMRGTGGQAEFRLPLKGGERHWVLFSGETETRYSPDKRMCFHRLLGQIDGCPLSDILDLPQQTLYDQSVSDAPGFFGTGFRERARITAEALSPLSRESNRKRMEPHQRYPAYRYLLHPDPKDSRILIDGMRDRLRLWVRQFRGWRNGHPDYLKSVIGFSRVIRSYLLQYEMLRKDGAFTEDELREIQAHLVFCARKISDESRWPHSRTFLHPDHPESVRDFYHYGGEHRSDRLLWTNALPNFQSDPLTCMVHIACVLPDHPEADAWRRKGLEDMETQLEAFRSASGCWEESINYTLFTLFYFVITLRVLRNRTGINYFEDARMRSVLQWLVRFFGPYDPRFQACTWPGVGNAVCPQNQAEPLLAFAGELEEEDPLRADLIAVFQHCAPALKIGDPDTALLLCAMAPIPSREERLPLRNSEVMADLGVAMRHRDGETDASYLFQKIGEFKSHYEADESAFNWYAKGVPLVMDYGTYSGDVMFGDAHNLVEIPDMDFIRRGTLADSFLSPALDMTRCEVPVTQKLLWGRVRSWQEIDGDSGPPLYHYIGDENPVGPKIWKTRILVYIKPDYVVLFDRVHGATSHRFNLHATVDAWTQQGNLFSSTGRFGLNLDVLIQHPAVLDTETREYAPRHSGDDPDELSPHRQQCLRVYNREDNLYRSLLFAREPERKVTLTSIGNTGLLIRTPDYEDVLFVGDQHVREQTETISFEGSLGWVRRWMDGRVQAWIHLGERIEAFGCRFTGRGPWTYGIQAADEFEINGVPRPVTFEYLKDPV